MLFDLESGNLTDATSNWAFDEERQEYYIYGTASPGEYFAEVFSAMYSANEELKSLIWEQVPETCEVIKGLIDHYITLNQ